MKQLKSDVWNSCSFFSLGINSFSPHFKLAYRINKSLTFKLVRSREDQVIEGYKVPFYTYTDLDTLEEWYFFPNRISADSDDDLISKSTGLGFLQQAVTMKYLSEVFKEAQAFLVCKNPFKDRDNKVLSVLKTIEDVNLSFLLDQKRFASALELNFL